MRKRPRSRTERYISIWVRCVDCREGVCQVGQKVKNQVVRVQEEVEDTSLREVRIRSVESNFVADSQQREEDERLSAASHISISCIRNKIQNRCCRFSILDVESK